MSTKTTTTCDQCGHVIEKPVKRTDGGFTNWKPYIHVDKMEGQNDEEGFEKTDVDFCSFDCCMAYMEPLIKVIDVV